MRQLVDESLTEQIVEWLFDQSVSFFRGSFWVGLMMKFINLLDSKLLIMKSIEITSPYLAMTQLLLSFVFVCLVYDDFPSPTDRRWYGWGCSSFNTTCVALINFKGGCFCCRNSNMTPGKWSLKWRTSCEHQDIIRSWHGISGSTIFSLVSAGCWWF